MYTNDRCLSRAIQADQVIILSFPKRAEIP
jgi:hypothetical protein